MNIEKIQEFREWWLHDKQSELRSACAEGWAFLIWTASREERTNKQHPTPSIGYTGCVICGQYTDHGGLQCPKLRPYS